MINNNRGNLAHAQATFSSRVLVHKNYRVRFRFYNGHTHKLRELFTRLTITTLDLCIVKRNLFVFLHSAAVLRAAIKTKSVCSRLTCPPLNLLSFLRRNQFALKASGALGLLLLLNTVFFCGLWFKSSFFFQRNDSGTGVGEPGKHNFSHAVEARREAGLQPRGGLENIHGLCCEFRFLC